jgi:hypothetical protein
VSRRRAGARRPRRAGAAEERRAVPEHSIGLVLDAKLFGRFRLLTVHASVDVARPALHEIGALSETCLDPHHTIDRRELQTRRREDVEALLSQAASALSRTRLDGDG